MPNAVLAAVVFLIGLRLIDDMGMGDILGSARASSRVAAVTAVTVVVVGSSRG